MFENVLGLVQNGKTYKDATFLLESLSCHTLQKVPTKSKPQPGKCP